MKQLRNLDFPLDSHLIDSWRDPEHLAIRVDENVGLVSHLVVTISTETGRNMLRRSYHPDILSEEAGESERGNNNSALGILFPKNQTFSLAGFY